MEPPKCPDCEDSKGYHDVFADGGYGRKVGQVECSTCHGDGTIEEPECCGCGEAIYLRDVETAHFCRFDWDSYYFLCDKCSKEEDSHLQECKEKPGGKQA